MEIARQIIIDARLAIIMAVTNEDGLDGGIAADVLAGLNIALGLDECDYCLAPSQLTSDSTTT